MLVVSHFNSAISVLIRTVVLICVNNVVSNFRNSRILVLLSIVLAGICIYLFIAHFLLLIKQLQFTDLMRLRAH